MKHWSRFLVLLPLLLAGCGDPAGPDEPWRSVQLDERVVHAYTDFGLNLFGTLAAEAPDSNLFVSPTSAAFALAMTYNGAAGETREAMARTLGITGMSREEVNRANREWLATLASTGDRRVELALANSLWGRQDFPFHDSFFGRTREFYAAEVRQLPFDDAAVQAMNGWVSTHTRGKIDEIIEEIDPLAVLYLLNALYFKGEWRYRFDPAETRDEPFLVPDGRRPMVPLMRQKVLLPYLRAEGFQALSLPYGSGRFSMVLVLPDESSSLAAFYARLTPERWNAWMDELRESEVQIFLPRFRLEWEKELNDVLKAMGMEIAFTGAADFSEMSPVDGLFIRKVKQKTFVEVNEQGTEAAAVTVVIIGRTSGPPTMRLDRPFFYAIRDNATGTLLFLGQVVDPS